MKASRSAEACGGRRFPQGNQRARLRIIAGTGNPLWCDKRDCEPGREGTHEMQATAKKQVDWMTDQDRSEVKL
jgi:hypothetical protein